MSDKSKYWPMTRSQSFIASALFLVVLFFLLLLTAVGKELLCWVNANAGLAAWIQAFGSIFAIVGAFLVVFCSHKLNEKANRDRIKVQEKVALIVHHGNVENIQVLLEAFLEYANESKALYWCKYINNSLDGEIIINIDDLKSLSLFNELGASHIAHALNIISGAKVVLSQSLFENISEGTARDLLKNIKLRLSEALKYIDLGMESLKSDIDDYKKLIGRD